MKIARAAPANTPRKFHLLETMWRPNGGRVLALTADGQRAHRKANVPAKTLKASEGEISSFKVSVDARWKKTARYERPCASARRQRPPAVHQRTAPDVELVAAVDGEAGRGDEVGRVLAEEAAVLLRANEVRGREASVVEDDEVRKQEEDGLDHAGETVRVKQDVEVDKLDLVRLGEAVGPVAAREHELCRLQSAADATGWRLGLALNVVRPASADAAQRLGAEGEDRAFVDRTTGLLAHHPGPKSVASVSRDAHRLVFGRVKGEGERQEELEAEVDDDCARSNVIPPSRDGRMTARGQRSGSNRTYGWLEEAAG